MKIVDFATIPMKEQLEVTYCSRVFVAPHSAALQWPYFMRPNSSVIEIAWPQFGWDYFHSIGESPTYKKVPLVFYQFETTNVTKLEESVRLQAKFGNTHISGNVTSKENMIRYKHLKLGKQCHFNVNPQKLLQLITKALPHNDK